MSIYHLPVKMITTDLASLLIHVRELNPTSVYVLSSPTVFKIPKVQHFVDHLRRISMTLTFPRVSPNAPIQYLDKIIKENSKPELIIGIGGGSVLDASKALSVGWKGPSILDIFQNSSLLPNSKVPVFAVPTTAGTGAELSYGAILFDETTKTKGGIRGKILQPDLALIDSELYASAKPKLIAEVGFDCLTHAIETYVSTHSTAIVRYQSVAAIQNVFKNLLAAAKGHKESLGKMAIAASIMGQNLALSTTCLPHRIQYSLGPKTGTSHAQGLIALYKGWLPEVESTQAFFQLSQDLGYESTEALINRINSLKIDLGIDYNLKSLNAYEHDILSIAKDVTGNLNSDPCYKDSNTIINILTNSL